jgi:hypothetical protein
VRLSRECELFEEEDEADVSDGVRLRRVSIVAVVRLRRVVSMAAGMRRGRW